MYSNDRIPNDSLIFRAGSPFARLTAMLSGVTPGADPLDMTLGEPRHKVPDFVAPILAAANAEFGRYPPIRGTDQFRHAVADWLERRYHLPGKLDSTRMVIPLSGSREGLFFAALAARRYLADKPAPAAVLLPNPFYQAYAAGAVMAGAAPIVLEAGSGDDLLPAIDSLDPALLDRTIAVYFASPANPQGTIAPLRFWQRLLHLARRHRFFVFADECYSEIYRDAPPVGALEAAFADDDLRWLVSFNSLSKRSNLAGLRCGFAAGDPQFLDFLANFRNMAAPQVPLPVQRVAAAAFGDETHVEENRDLYNRKFAIADELLAGRFGYRKPPGGFFLWLDVATAGGGEKAARRLWAEAGLRVLPGGFLATLDSRGNNPGAPFIRLALVGDIETTRTALQRLVDCLSP